MDFKTHLQSRGMAVATIKRHEQELAKYTSFLADHNMLPEAATQKELLGYLKHLKINRKLANSTQNQVLGMLKNYYIYLCEYEGITNVFKLLKIRGVRRSRLRPVFDTDTLDLLCEEYLNYTKQYAPNGRELRFYPDFDSLLKRRYLALTLLCYQGLHASEILALRPEHFDLKKATVRITETKRSNARTLPLEAKQMMHLVAYLGSKNTKIVPNINQLELLNKTLKNRTKNDKIPFLDFRQLRASRITFWIKTVGLRKAQYLAGHRTISGTQRYQNYGVSNLEQGLQKYHPLH